MTFTHLHVASCFSSHYGTATPGELAAAAAAGGAEALALTDRDGLYGAVQHIDACTEHGLKPLLGADLAVKDHGRVTVLAHGSKAGYTALCQAVSAAHEGTSAVTSGPEVALSRARLAQLSLPASSESPRLFILLGVESDIGRLAAARDYRGARTALRQWRQALGAAVYVELVSHLAPPGEELSTAHAARMLSAAAACRVPTVLTNAVRLRRADEAATADVLDAVRVLSSLDSAPLQPNDQGWLKPEAEMHRLAAEICDASTVAADPEDILSVTEELARSCQLDPTEHMTYGVPKIPEAHVIGIARPADEELRFRCEQGLGQRLAEPQVRQRLEHELAIIEELGFSSYFLTVAEVVRLIHELGVRCAARGSGVSSLVVHALGISPIDPLSHGLIFERFLSQRRATLPDIDIDVESARRHEIYQRVFDRFGRERVTLMSMQNAYRIRGAVRDAGMALGLPDEELDQLAEIMWRFPAREFRQALEEKPELKQLAQRIETERVSGRTQLDLLVDLTERLDRLPRHISTHPCGVILGDKDLLRLTPVQPSGVTGLPMSQFGKDDMDSAGFIKLDILGVRMQSAIAHCLSEIERTSGEHIDLNTISFQDQRTFDLIQSTHTLGCFQIESPGQRELIGKLIPASLEDLILDISLFRPGPMGAGMVRPFLERRHGFESIRYPHPDLIHILEETCGVIVYHEQVLRIFDTMTDCGLATADVLRRALSQEHTSAEVESYFRTRTAARGYGQEVIDQVWRQLASFGSFGFCKAHAAAFAVPTYQSAWLKTHYPAAFMTGLFEHDPGMYPLRLLVAEARRLQIPLLPMDVNRSKGHYRLEKLPTTPPLEPPADPTWGIRMALTTLKGISAAEIRRLEKEQPFHSLADLRDRAKPRFNTMKSLAKVGALDSFLSAGTARNRRNDLFAWIERTGQRKAQQRRPPLAAGQLALPLTDTETSNLPASRPGPTDTEVLATELDLTSVDLTDHVMSVHWEQLTRAGVTFAKDLLHQRSGATVCVAGIRVATQTPPMASGKRVVFISLDDGTGVVDLSFFEEGQAHTGEALFAARMLMAEGTIRRTGPRAVTVQATRAWDLQESSS
ncbi:DNA polymerase III subunit alpha [Nesterenkonia sphaerica]|uniref:DNA-directed DNA polymerase n=1 Tax=Nesterenkonia sphaerica TaxID=1804988 RepID=A0A5R9AMY1_9MICC|nr:DNA polymerase III subunit alpha [Nesterenkonia sphaerica]TLP79494.1 DNA polymerase III subunit alpha [Nesterenkonia sphaerica]